MLQYKQIPAHFIVILIFLLLKMKAGARLNTKVSVLGIHSYLVVTFHATKIYCIKY